MTRFLVASGLCFILTSCGNTEPSSTSPQAAATDVQQCGKDTDCKGDRICDAGQCTSPSAATPVAQAPVQPADPSAPPSSSDPVPVCAAGDGKTRIPVWQPAVDGDGNLSSDPPQQDGQIVYIRLHSGASDVKCSDGELNAFSRPDTPGEPTAGGLAVNLRGNTQFANGQCHFAGYYMNEDVKGMHQGWIETYFGAVDKKEVVLSGKYCLAEAIE